jgi:hypothetical protein
MRRDVEHSDRRRGVDRERSRVDIPVARQRVSGSPHEPHLAVIENADVVQRLVDVRRGGDAMHEIGGDVVDIEVAVQVERVDVLERDHTAADARIPLSAVDLHPGLDATADCLERDVGSPSREEGV